MPEGKDSPRPKQPSRAAVSYDKDGRAHYDVADGVRDIFETLFEGLSQEEAGKRVGMPQMPYGRFMRRKSGMNLKTLSKVLNRIQESPTRFFSRHPAYDRRGRLRVAANRVEERFRAVLTPKQQEDLVELLEELSRRGSIQPAIKAVAAVVAASKPRPPTATPSSSRKPAERKTKKS